MDTKRKAAFAALALGLVSTGSLIAATQTQAFGQAKDDFAQALATRFNLNVTDVQSFLDEQHAAHMNEPLDAAVADGKITAEQKAAIVAKRQELKTKMESLKDASNEDRRAAMESFHTEMKAWAETNGIDLRLMGGAGMNKRGHGGFGGHFKATFDR